MFELSDSEMWSTVGQRHVAAARLALRRAHEPLGGEQAERLANGRAADAEVARELRLRREPPALLELAGDDQLAELVGDLLVALPDAPERELLRRLPLLRSSRHDIPNSALPATETGFVEGGSTPAK